MAKQAVQLDRETFSCSICLDLLTDPVAIPCGHSYCMNCIKSFWDEGEQKKNYHCPQCGKSFTQRPDLEKNTMLAALVEQLNHSYTVHEDVACDFCTGRKLKAIKSCLFCLASYCEKHLQPHYDVAPLKKHKLVEPSKNLQENICSEHGKVIDIFCRKDKKCICYLCSVDEHKGHNTVSAAAERAERQKKLEERRGNIQQRIQDREKDVEEQKEKVVFINCSADESVEVCEKIFMDLIHLIQRKSSAIKNYIKSEQETEVRKAEDEQKKLEQEIVELKREDAELEQFLDTEDDIQFLKKDIPEPKLFIKMPKLSFLNNGRRISAFHKIWLLNDVKAAVSEAESTVEQIVTNMWMEISLKEIDSEASSSTPTEGLMDRDELLKYSQELTLDPKTANRYLYVTRKRAEKEDKEQFKDKSERFANCCQVLSKDSLTECSYWEVKSSGRFTVAVEYKDIRETGRFYNQTFGLNENSWSLECCELMYIFRHNKTLTLISAPHSATIGVFLDHRAGILSFYSVSETTTLLYRVQTRFTQPLLAGIRLYETGDSAEFCQLRELSRFVEF